MSDIAKNLLAKIQSFIAEELKALEADICKDGAKEAPALAAEASADVTALVNDATKDANKELSETASDISKL